MDAIAIHPSDNSEHEESIVSTLEICRVCLLDNLAMRDLFLENEVASLSAKAMSFANIKMLPGDGLPGQVCCMCADKLESAYEFKLQVEHADTVLRERFLTINIKDELFFNEVEVHLESERHEHTEELPIDPHYEGVTATLTSTVSTHPCSTIKDSRMSLLPMEKVDQLEHIAEQESEQSPSKKIESASEVDGLNFLESSTQHEIQQDIDMAAVITQNTEERLDEAESISINVAEKPESESNAIRSDEHDYILHETPSTTSKTTIPISESQSCLSTVEASTRDDESDGSLLCDEEETFKLIDKAVASTRLKMDKEQSKIEKSQVADEENISREDESSQIEMRRSKRNSTRKNAIDNNNSAEENYFENLNLSSRLKKVNAEQVDSNEKIFFACYLCDKQFLTKDLLKEHLHSHEEVRKTLLLTKTTEKVQKPGSNSPEKMPSSGKKANKCPYCGKEYLYIISFKKHLKQHEREKEENGKDIPVSQDVSFEEDEHSLDAEDHYSSRRKSALDSRKRRRRYQTQMEDDNKNKADSEENKTLGGQEEKGRKSYGDEDERSGGAFDETAYDEENDRKEGKPWRKRCRTSGFECDKCSDRFSSKRDLRKHAITHISLKCSVCQESFDSLEKLRNHRTKHVLEGVLSEQDLEESAKYAQEYKKEVDEGAIGSNAMIDSDDNEESDYDDHFNPSGDLDSSFGKNRSREEEADYDYVCKFCDEPFARKDQLQRHMEHQHPQPKSYKCTECNKTFGNELTLRNHLIATNHKTFVHGQQYDPNKRIKRVAARAAQKIIDKIKTEDGLEELEEDEDNDGGLGSESERSTYGRRRDATSQRRGYGRKELECADCNKRCSSKQALSKHMEQHAKDEKGDKSKKLNVERKDGQQQKSQRNTIALPNKDGNPESERGSTGNQGAIIAGGNGAGNGNNCGGIMGGMIGAADADDDDSDFESGLDWPMDNHECPTCKKRYSTKKSLLRHQLLHEEPNFECDICSVKFYRKDKLKAHYDKCSEKNPDQVRKCNICGDSFENNEMLREHRAKHVTEGILTEEDLRDIEPRPEEKKQGERVGRKRRTDIVGLECTECNKQYTSRKGLLRHIQVHEGKKYLCDICPKKFYRREHLKIHVAKHNMIKPYKCNRCTKRFIKEEQLTNHLSKHDRTFKKTKETDSTKRFLCEICSKSFTQSTTLIAHLRAHNGIKPYVCEVCSRPFTTNAYLKMHMRTHTQERPYICQYCSRAFARADTLANHLTSHTGEAKYHCKYCPKNFRRLKSLKEHVFIHTGQRPYACPTCDRRFNNNGSRYAHSKRCKQNFAQNQNRAQNVASVPLQSINQHQNPNQQRLQQSTITSQIVKTQNIKTIAITRQPDPVATQQVMQHQEILMPLIFEILPEGTKIFTTT